MNIPYLLYLTNEINDCVMLWNKTEKFIEIPFETESDLEDAVHEVKEDCLAA
jgi:hypothetical protein